ncbi:Ig-like domain-containing protein [Pseudactinotalea sp. Z1732]|uniref:Ig-like domain-containing protein n=1 Tax=Pseudactinotalea sp. Z1732 TaxID=3413026 RepID=UPI003C7EA71F
MVSLVLGTVVALSLNYEGVATADVELNDGGVWVSNSTELAMGRLNYPVQQIDASLAATSQNIDLLQRHDVVFMRDLASGTIQRVDTAQVATSGPATQLPANADVAMGEGTVGVLNSRSGEYHVLGLDELGVLDEGTAPPLADLGAQAAHVVADDGTAFGLNGLSGELLTVSPELRAERSAAAESITDDGATDADSGGTGAQNSEPDDTDAAGEDANTDAQQEDGEGEEVDLEALEPEISQLEEAYFDASVQTQMTAVGTTPVVLSMRQEGPDAPVEAVLVQPRENVLDLSGLDVDLASARLQAASPDGNSVAIATTDALIEVPLRGGEPVVWKVQTPGEPVQPVQVSGCLHGAWTGSAPLHLRTCRGADPVEQAIPSAGAGADLVFRVNRQLAVLNDMRNGDSWMLEDTLILVDNWEDITPPQDQQEEEEESLQEIRDEVPLDREAENRDPNAEPDSFGVRAGRTVMLPVLDNDSDPDGDLLTVSEFEDVPESFGTVEHVLGGRALQIHVAAEASGQHRFSYTADDGRGGTDSAQVSLDVVPPGQNSPPEQLRDIGAEVVAGESVEVNIMNDVRDPDGDPMYVIGAEAPESLEVITSPNGLTSITDRGIEVGLKQIVVLVGDGTDIGEVLIDIEVLPDGPYPPTAVFDFATAFVGETITVEPLVNDIDPNGRPLRLSHVEQVPNAQIVTDNDAGTFTFTSDIADDYYMTYIVADDDGSSATGLVRVSVVGQDEGAPPVAVADTALLPPGGSVLVDVLENDSDPAGGVLAVQQIDVPPGLGLHVAIVDHRLLRISSNQTLSEPVTLTYTVSNGDQSAVGEVQVLPLVHAEAARPPIAVRDSARVRVGDYVTIPVLANDSHPNGLEFSLDTDLVEEPEAGLMFVAGDVVRYMAPDTPQTVTGVYRITDENGQSHSAPITVNVVASGDESNSPPVPEDVVSRAFAGERVRIPINTHGIDPDGDSVRVLGVESSPELGRIVEQGPGYLDYQPYTDSRGTDEFRYTVQDRLGAVAAASITVGVINPPDRNRPPVAVPDEVTVRPDREVQVDVLANDTDPDGDRLVFGDPSIADDGGLADVGIRDATVLFTSPSEPGTYLIQYLVSDRNGGEDVGTLSITVDPDADPQPPVAVDDQVPADAIAGMETITVGVLENDYDPDGSVDALRLSVPEGNPTARLSVDGRELEVDLTPERQVITYQITDEDELSSYAFVEVPGLEDTGPVKRSDAPPIEVDSGDRIEIPLDDHVTSMSGDPVQLTDFSLVRATNSDGSELVVDEQTLAYTSAEGYHGPATITFEVTDALDLNVDGLRSSVITLDITVHSVENVAPQMRPGSLELEAGGDPGSLNLQRLAEDPDGEVHLLTYEIVSVPAGFDASIDDANILTASAGNDTTPGTEEVMEVEVTDPEGASVTGEITLTATASNRPLIVANDDDAGEVHQGESVTVDVLANDSNPFPGEARTLLFATTEAGVADVSVSGDNVTFTPGSDYVGRLSIVYTVVDVTGDPDRQVQARVSAAVIGAPEAPAPPRVESVGNQQAQLSWSPPTDNGSPITGYRVEGGGVSQMCGSTTCTITGLTNGTVYNFTVIAINAVGESPASGASGDARPDVKPDAPGAPTVEFGDTELTLNWNQPNNEGTPITHYDVRISPGGGGSDQVSVTGTGHTWTGLTNGQAYTFQVRAVNEAPDPGDWSAWSAAEIPSGPPFQPDAPRATRVDIAAGGQLQVSWTEPNTNGDSIDAYHLYMYKDGVAQPVITVGGSTRQRTVNVENAHDYTFAVVAQNRAGESEASPQSTPVRSFGAPGRTQGVSASADGENGRATISYTAPNDNGQPISRYEYRLNGGSVQALPSGGRISGLNNGSSYTAQVRACNTYCGQWSASSNSFTPYGPPVAGSVSSDVDERRVSFSWRSPSGNGASIERSEYRTRSGSSGWTSWQRGTPTDSTSLRGDWEETHRIEVRWVNNHGQTSPVAADSRRAADRPPPPEPPPVPRAWVTKGDARPCDRGTNCHTFRLHWSDWPAGTHDVNVRASGSQCGTFDTSQRNGPYRMSMGGNGSAIITHQGYTPPHYGSNCTATVRPTISGAPGNAVIETRNW